MKLATQIGPVSGQADSLVEEQLPYLRQMASRISRTLPAHIELDELVSLGAEGLCQAARRFEASQGASFRTFSHYRMKGAIFDGLRRMIAQPAVIDDDFVEPELLELRCVEDSFDVARRAGEVRDALDMLAPEERRLLELHYFQELTLSEAAQEMGCSKSWASRLHDRALSRLRAALEGHC